MTTRIRNLLVFTFEIIPVGDLKIFLSIAKYEIIKKIEGMVNKTKLYLKLPPGVIASINVVTKKITKKTWEKIIFVGDFS